jgi:N-acetylglutamate synthase-like GNAT family acetyltransferase
MAFRRKSEGVLTIEQTRDLEAVRRLLSQAGLSDYGVDSPASCYIMAYEGRAPIGVVGVEAKVTAALIRDLFVLEQFHQEAIATDLFLAARKAAHTRGARELYRLGANSEAADFWKRLGFEEVRLADLLCRFDGVPQIEYYKSHPEELERKAAFRLDISGDGVIDR